MHRSGTGKGSRMGPGVLVRWVFPSFTVMGRRGGEVERSPWLWEGAAFGVPTVLPSGVEEVGGGGAGFAHLLLRRHLCCRYSVPCQLLGGINNEGAEESVEKSDKRAHGLIPFFLLTPAVYKALF